MDSDNSNGHKNRTGKGKEQTRTAKHKQDRKETNPESSPGLQQQQCWERLRGAAESGSAVKGQQSHLTCTPPRTTISTAGNTSEATERACSIDILQPVTWAECTSVNLPSKKKTSKTKKLPNTQSSKSFSSTSDYQYRKN